MTEDELFRNIHTLIMGTNVTYKQVDSDLDEEGDVTIFFSNLETADHGSSSLIDSLEHWAKCFRDGTLDDSNAEEIA